MLSLKAKGLLSLMLSLPENWNYTTRGLATICKDGVDSICSAVNELEEHGYVRRERIRNAKGQLTDIQYTILERPEPPLPEQENPNLEEPEQENPAQLNTKKLSNQPLKKRFIKYGCINSYPIKSFGGRAAGGGLGRDGYEVCQRYYFLHCLKF